MTTPKVVVCMPCYGAVPPRTMNSLLRLVTQSRGAVADCLFSEYLYVAQARELLVDMVLRGEGPRLMGIPYRAEELTHLLFLDADMDWPADTVPRLLARGKDVVGGLYFQKGPPFTPVAYDFDDYAAALPLERRLAFGAPTGLKAVGGMGFGCCLIDLKLLRRLKSWLDDPLSSAPPPASEQRLFRSDDCGEDVFFFRLLGKAFCSSWTGAYLDCDLRCAHLGPNWVEASYWQMWQQMQRQSTL